MQMLSNKPYLIRGFYEWILDSACTPILVIDANYPRCKVPQDFVKDGEIAFNISSSAVRDLKLKNDFIEFKASFSGVIHIVFAPIKAILALYAEENNEEGIFFDMEEVGEAEEIMQLTTIEGTAGTSVPDHLAASETSTRERPVLTLVE